MSDTLEMLSRMVGVIDLKDSVAVRAVAGHRKEYRPVRSFCRGDGKRVPIDGCHQRLVECYRDAGLDALYIADLDGLETGICQTTCIERIVEAASGFTKLWIDVGLEHRKTDTPWDWVDVQTERHPELEWIVASECVRDRQSLRRCVARLGGDRVAASCDYFQTRWMSERLCEADWIDDCNTLGIGTVIALELTSVGCQSVDPTLQLCRRIRHRLPKAVYLTGGGIRSRQDAERVLDAGADRLLVASRFVD